MAKQVWTVISQIDTDPPVATERHTLDAAMRLSEEFEHQNAHVTFCSVHQSKPPGETIRAWGVLRPWWTEDMDISARIDPMKS